MVCPWFLHRKPLNRWTNHGGTMDEPWRNPLYDLSKTIQKELHGISIDTATLSHKVSRLFLHFRHNQQPIRWGVLIFNFNERRVGKRKIKGRILFPIILFSDKKTIHHILHFWFYLIRFHSPKKDWFTQKIHLQ